MAIIGYEYRIDGGSPVDIGLPDPLTFTVDGLTPGTDYDFEIRGYDTEGNRTDWSNVAQATTVAGLGGLSDNFNDGILAPVWQTNGSTISETGGRLQISGTASAYIRTVITYDMTGDTIRVQFRDLPIGSGSYAQQLLLADGDAFANYWLVQKFGSNIELIRNGSGVFSIPFDPVDHLYVQLRFSGGNILLEASPDSVSFTTLHTAPVVIAITALYVYLRTFNTGSDVTHEWDNFDSTL